MTGTFVASTPRDRMHPLAFQGILATDCFAQISELLRTRLGTGHMLLFAEPVADPGRNVIDWYSPVQGEVRPLAELPADRQQACLEEFRIKGEEIRKTAETLCQADDARRAMAGHMLALALDYPDASMLYVVGEQPVLVGWGFGPASAGAQPENITRVRCEATGQGRAAAMGTAASSPEPSSPASEEPRRGVAFWWWLLPLVLLAALLALLLVSWGGRPPLVPGLSLTGPDLFARNSSVNPLPRLKEEEAREATLKAELTTLQGQLAQKAELCTAPPAALPPSEPEPVLPPNELVVPEQAGKDDMSFMEGVWRCETGLVNTSTGAPVVVEYAFDSKGKGSISIEGDKGLCKAAATSTIREGVLVIETEDEIACSKGSAYSGQQVECSGKGVDALCRGVNLSKGAVPWNASFYRKR